MTDNCIACDELRKYTKDETIKCSRCTPENEEYTNESKELDLLARRMQQNARVYLNNAKSEHSMFFNYSGHINLNDHIMYKLREINSSSEYEGISFDVFISLDIFNEPMSCRSSPSLTYTFRLTNRNILKKEFNVDDETIDKMSKLLRKVKNRNVYALYSLPDNKDTFEGFIGNTIAEYYKFKTIMNLMNKIK